MSRLWNTCEGTGNDHSDVHHLMAIATLLRESGVARTGDIARHLSLARPEVEHRLANLTKRGLVIRPQKRHYALSSVGVDVVNSVLAKRRILRSFFEDVLELSPEVAAEDACRIEHLLSSEAADRLVAFMGNYLSDSDKGEAFRRALRDFVGKPGLTPRLDIVTGDSAPDPGLSGLSQRSA